MKTLVVKVDECPRELVAVDHRGHKRRYIVLATKDGKGVCLNGLDSISKRRGFRRRK